MVQSCIECKVTLRSAAKVKVLLLEAVTKAQETVLTVSKDTRYKWADNPENIGVVKEALGKVQAEVTTVQRDFLLQSPADLKKTYSSAADAAKLHIELEAFVKLKDKAMELNNLVTQIIKRSNV